MPADVQDIAPGLWIWRVAYPDWRPDAGWPEHVTSTCVETGGEGTVGVCGTPTEGAGTLTVGVCGTLTLGVWGTVT